MPAWSSPTTLGRERHYRLRSEGLGVVADLLREIGAVAARPPVTEATLDGLDLEVRRVGRDRRADEQRQDATDVPHRATGEIA